MKRTPTDVKIYRGLSGIARLDFPIDGWQSARSSLDGVVGFSHRSVQEKNIASFGLPQHYDALRNVTIANDMDYAKLTLEMANGLTLSIILMAKGG
jgi:hypothetical protein